MKHQKKQIAKSSKKRFRLIFAAVLEIAISITRTVPLSTVPITVPITINIPHAEREKPLPKADSTNIPIQPTHN